MIYPIAWLHFDKRGDVWACRWDPLREGFTAHRVADQCQAYSDANVLNLERGIDTAPAIKGKGPTP